MNICSPGTFLIQTTGPTASVKGIYDVQAVDRDSKMQMSTGAAHRRNSSCKLPVFDPARSRFSIFESIQNILI